MNLLDFEKPIAELEGKLADMKHLADGSDDSVKKAVEALEKKITDLKKETFENLTGWQQVSVIPVTLIDHTRKTTFTKSLPTLFV